MPGGCSERQVMGMIKGFFWVSNFQFWDFWGVGKFVKYFLGWLDLSGGFVRNPRDCLWVLIFPPFDHPITNEIRSTLPPGARRS